MLGNYIDAVEASKILDVHPETVKRLKFGSKGITERDRLQVFANTHEGDAENEEVVVRAAGSIRKRVDERG